MSEPIEHDRRDDERMRDIIDRVSEQAANKAATVAVPQAIATTLKSLGMDTSDPLTIQKNMAFLNESRMRCEKFYSEMWNRMTGAMWTIIKVIVAAGIVAILAKFGFQVDAFSALLSGVP